MTADHSDEASRNDASPDAALPRPVQEHLARQLRAAYVETQEKPAYLGDPALPPAFDEHLHALRATEIARERERAGAQGLSAVSTALESLQESPAQDGESDGRADEPS